MAGGPDPGPALSREEAYGEAYARGPRLRVLLVGLALFAGAAASIVLRMPTQAFAPNAGTAGLFAGLGFWAGARAISEARQAMLIWRDPAFAGDGAWRRLPLLFPPALAILATGTVALALLCAGLLLSGTVPSIREAIDAFAFALRFVVLQGRT